MGPAKLQLKGLRMIDSQPSDLFQPGDLLNNTYRIEMLLGRGGTSDVYKARSEISGNLVAIKVLKQELSGNEDFTVLMAREENIREIRHDAVVRYSENHRTPDGHIYLLMDYIDGPGLDKKLKQGPMSSDDLLTVCRRVSEGLQAAHSRNIVHRDLSPDNIILRNGEPAQAVIIDFGIAKDTNPGAETIVGNEFAGKYSYAAPEQMAGLTDARSDIYSLGALLLANFRGKSPSLGDNPMEVVENKKLPLNTDGLPQPLKLIIERMCEPDPDKRLQSATAVLEFLDNPIADSDAKVDDPIEPPVAGADDATIIVPATSRAATASKKEPENAAPQKKKPNKSSAPLVLGLLLLLLTAAGIGGSITGAFDGLFGPTYPAAEPFTLIVEKKRSGHSRAVGNVPSPETEEALKQFVGQTELTLASGDINKNWANDVLAVIEPLEPLLEWRLAVSNNQARLTGVTNDAALAADLNNRFGNGMPGNLEGVAEITFVLPSLPLSEVRSVTEGLEDCGPLRIFPAKAVGGFAPEEPIVISGRIASPESRIRIFDALRKIAGERKITIDTEVLNPSLCVVEQFLPNAPSGDIVVEFRVGGEDKANPSGRFFVGENPIIDVILPSGMTSGYLTVSILDVSGNVFHLLPNISRQDNAIADLRAGATGQFPIRVAYDLAESAQTGGIAFRVDDSTLGKSRILVLHSAEPLFDGMRPTSESAVGFAEALKESAARDAGLVLSMDSKILITAEP